MRAMVVRRYGPPDVLEWHEVPDPELEANQVVIRVAAVGINFADLLARLGIYQGTPKPPFVPGLEVAGTVEQVPPAPVGRGKRLAKEDAPFQVGERVAALTMFNGYAERVAVPERQVFHIPEGVTVEEAAALPVNYLTAYHSMFQMGNLQEGDRVLVHGAAGGLGVAAVQLAKARKLVVLGTAGPAKQEFLQKMGVDYPIDHSREDFEEVIRRTFGDGIEMVLDAIGGKSFAKSYRCLGPTGRLVVYGFSTVVAASGRRNLWKIGKALLETPRFHPLKLINDNKSVIGVHIGRMPGHAALLKREMEEIFKMYAAGQVKPVIGKTFPLEHAAESHRYIHARQNVGKVILKVT